RQPRTPRRTPAQTPSRTLRARGRARTSRARSRARSRPARPRRLPRGAAAGTESRRPHVLRQMRAVVLDRAPEAFAQADARPPARDPRELRRVGIETADVDPFLLVGPRHVPDAPRTGDVDQHLDEIAVRDRLEAAHVK